MDEPNYAYLNRHSYDWWEREFDCNLASDRNEFLISPAPYLPLEKLKINLYGISPQTRKTAPPLTAV